MKILREANGWCSRYWLSGERLPRSSQSDKEPSLLAVNSVEAIEAIRVVGYPGGLDSVIGREE